MPGEIILRDVEAAGQPLDALAQDRGDSSRRIGGEGLVLRGRNAEAIKRGRLPHDPADERLLEDRRKAFLIERTLLGERPGLEDDRRVEAVQARERVTCPEEAPEQAVAVEVAREQGDAPAAERRSLVPVGARGRVEPAAQPLVIGRHVGARVGAAEEAEEGLVVGQVLERADLELAERDMRPVEVDRGDAGRIGGQIGQHVAAARGDGDDLMSGPDVERLHVDDRVLPDLGIDEASKTQA